MSWPTRTCPTCGKAAKWYVTLGTYWCKHCNATVSLKDGP